ncbi:TetR/AcrR family transcriptional regulator [Pararhizobium qamdonense]|uniref:TetR/AcrR family transcriptional regulator n=1 Tax=Pararhizobium qamdonense TaxID=3031126 RepID=UPI0023E2E5DD|nr:TetR/AcrR family transcriptional regulator [Pararhizobium qamdonense]
MNERGGGGRPTREQTIAIDNALLDGARDAFGRKGIINASIDEIAELLGVSKHTIYRRYKTKTDLLGAVVSRDIKRFQDRLRAAGKGGASPLDAVRRTASCYVEIGCSRDYAGLYLSLIAEAVVSDELRHLFSGWTRQSLDPLMEALLTAQEEKAVASVDAKFMCSILVDLLEGINNTVRLYDDANGEPPDQSILFKERWRVFLTLFATEPQRRSH